MDPELAGESRMEAVPISSVDKAGQLPIATLHVDMKYALKISKSGTPLFVIIYIYDIYIYICMYVHVL